MPLTTRYGFADAPTAAILGDSSLAWTTAFGSLAAAGTSLLVVSSAAFPSGLQFDILIGIRDVSTGLWSNAEIRHVSSVAGTTWTVSAGTLDHISGESIAHVLTAAGLQHNPGSLTTSGDTPYLNSSGRMDRLAAPADGDYALRWASGVPSYIAASSGGLSYADLATPPGGTALGSLAAPFNALYVGPPEATLPLLLQAYATPAASLITNTATVHAALAIEAANASFGIQSVIQGPPSGNPMTVALDTSAYAGWNDAVLIGASSYIDANGYALTEWSRNYYAWYLGLSGGSVVKHAAFYTDAQGGLATHAYAFWADERGVFQIKADHPFDSVYQAIPALYNPQFTKYMAGATDFERIVLGQWHGNVAEIGTEQGGTGTLRAVKVIGASLDTPATLTANGVAVATQSYVTGLGYTTLAAVAGVGYATASSATAFTNKTGAISQWTNDASYTTLAAVAGVGYLTSVTAHTVLSTTHGDTLADTVVRGDLFYGNSTPKWARLPKPSVLSGLSHDGTDVSWVTASGTGAPARVTSPTFITPVLGVASATSLATSAASPLLLTNGQLVTIALTSQTVNPATLTIPNFASVSDTFAFLTLAQTFTNKKITKRVITASDATSITPNSDNADVTYQLNTQTVGTLTINADTGAPTNGQSWLLKIKNTNVQTFAWNGLFVGGTIALPTTTSGGSKIDYYSFVYDTANTKWHFVGSAAGF
jgi:hypothetical protein